MHVLESDGSLIAGERTGLIHFISVAKHRQQRKIPPGDPKFRILSADFFSPIIVPLQWILPISIELDFGEVKVDLIRSWD
jgi:hypothetical protein